MRQIRLFSFLCVLFGFLLRLLSVEFEIARPDLGQELCARHRHALAVLGPDPNVGVAFGIIDHTSDMWFTQGVLEPVESRRGLWSAQDQ